MFKPSPGAQGTQRKKAAPMLVVPKMYVFIQKNSRRQKSHERPTTVRQRCGNPAETRGNPRKPRGNPSEPPRKPRGNPCGNPAGTPDM